MIIIFILVKNKKKKSSFFEKTFVLIEIIIDIIFNIPFLILSNVKCNFINQKLDYRFYIIT